VPASLLSVIICYYHLDFRFDHFLSLGYPGCRNDFAGLTDLPNPISLNLILIGWKRFHCGSGRCSQRLCCQKSGHAECLMSQLFRKMSDPGFADLVVNFPVRSFRPGPGFRLEFSGFSGCQNCLGSAGYGCRFVDLA
jgi:hypothetical protein